VDKFKKVKLFMCLCTTLQRRAEDKEANISAFA